MCDRLYHMVILARVGVGAQVLPGHAVFHVKELVAGIGHRSEKHRSPSLGYGLDTKVVATDLIDPIVGLASDACRAWHLRLAPRLGYLAYSGCPPAEM